MSNIVKLPEPKDQWQFTVDVVRRPDGVFAAILVDARTSLIESGEMEPHQKLHQIADILESAIRPMRANAESLKP